jgi:Na+-driven multidrug efflux pump
MIDDDTRAQEDDGTSLPGARLRRVGAVAWPSFFAAAVASVVFFAIVDPSELADITWPHLAISREFGYSIGFFMFWACTFSSSAFTALLLSARVKRASRQRKQPIADR